MKSSLISRKVSGPLTLITARAPPGPVAGAAMVVSGFRFIGGMPFNNKLTEKHLILHGQYKIRATSGIYR